MNLNMLHRKCQRWVYKCPYCENTYEENKMCCGEVHCERIIIKEGDSNDK
ncbi:MAG: hypothetical protein ACD_33C00046G0004 [uncultured bacterium]|nr:MAG: hypothetical protein ACD_33C00046G0004 [uncultured bacterium]